MKEDWLMGLDLVTRLSISGDIYIGASDLITRPDLKARP